MSETAAEQQPGWQRGYSLEHLRQYTDVFKGSDKGFVLGAFTGFKERDAAAALEHGQLRAVWSPDRTTGTFGDGYPVAAVVWRVVKQRQGIKDFTGQTRARMEPGDIHVGRLGCLPGHEDAARSLLQELAQHEVAPGGALFAQVWQESPQHREILEALPFQLVAVKIPASSELVGVYACARRGRTVEYTEVPEPEVWGLRRLGPSPFIPEEQHAAAVGCLGRVPSYADHYSSYNRGHSWRALSLRGFSYDPDFIIKPAEMSKRWKEENPRALQEPCRNTPLRANLPELEPLIAAVPGEHQRIRLMRLEAGGGELTRHADVTDLESGTAERHVLRVHLPLVTNGLVRFCSWTLGGEQYARHMGAREAWYLDTRKPHTAINSGDSPRVHLVVDAYSSDELLHLLDLGE